MTRFDIVDLRLFVNIAETGSLTQGAQRSFMSLPAASVRVKNLEEQIGTRLLHRSNHGVRLTSAGKAFLYHGRAILRGIENLQDDLQRYSRGVKGDLRVLTSATAAAEFLPSVLRDFLLMHPDVTLDIRERSSFEIVPAIIEHVADIGIFVSNPSLKNDEVNLLPYRTERLVLVTALSHPLAEERSVIFERTVSYDYVTLSESKPIHIFLNRVAPEVQKRLRVCVQAGNSETLCRMVEMNIGVGILFESSALRHARHAAIRIIPISNPWSVRDVRICTRKADILAPFAGDFIDLLKTDGEAALVQDRKRELDRA